MGSDAQNRLTWLAKRGAEYVELKRTSTLFQSESSSVESLFYI